MQTASMRTAYGEALVEAGRENKNIVVLEADLSKATKTSLFAKAFPERFFNIGIAEQNMMSMAAGFATCGKVPFATALAVFASMRALEQVRTSVCIGNLNVKIGAPYGGLATAENGPTHQCISDINMMRGLPNMTVLAPSDAVSCKACVHWAVKHKGPVYIRILRDGEPVLYEKKEDVNIENGNRLHEGNDMAIICNGFTSHMALQAAEELTKEGMHVTVHDIFCIKPIAADVILDIAQKCKRIITVEEHNIYGGLGSAVAEVISQSRPVPLKIMGVNDYFSDSGSHKDLLERAGLTVENIIRQVKDFVE
ncbi:MAG: transketolase family protein [Candidatus Omnitrophica bacterium]|nr:transketolase family protein [Candidatus Omnitrophota bacterium]